MNLGEWVMPTTSTELISTYTKYYSIFYLEMVRMSNSKLQAYVEQFLELLSKLSKSPRMQDQMRACYGVLALHSFGYRDEETLDQIFDRTVPQIDKEYVLFTSWVAGRLTHHPDLEQSRYVQHLLERTLGWIRAKGRRTRPLAAACMIKELAMNAGSNIVGFLPHFQSTIWLLVSNRTLEVLKVTADTIGTFSRAMIRYARNEMPRYLNFMAQLCIRLMSFGSPIRVYASVIVLEQLILCEPQYFLNKMMHLYSSIADAVNGSPKIVQAAFYVTASTFCLPDPKVFIDVIADELFDKTEGLIKEYDSDIVRALVLMTKNIPEFIETRFDDIKHLVSIIPNPEGALTLLSALVEKFGTKINPIDRALLVRLAKVPFTIAYKDFFINLLKNPELLPKDVLDIIYRRIKTELNGPYAITILNFIAEMPESMTEPLNNYKSIVEMLGNASSEVKTAVPKAIYSLIKKTDEAQIDECNQQLIRTAVCDTSTLVRCSILRVLMQHVNHSLAKPENMKIFQMLCNDDSHTVRLLAFQIIAKLSKFNPLYVASITRCSLLDYFFILRHVSSIRQRSRIIKTLPNLIQASGLTIAAYSSGFMEIAMNILRNHSNNAKFDNFLEKDADTQILAGIMDSIALLAPLDPVTIIQHADELIPLICDYLEYSADERNFALSILRLIKVLLSAPASNVVYRAQAPIILSACSKFLASTHSRKIRIAILNVIGVLGILEVHQRALPKLCQCPENVDPELARQFFQPSRDTEEAVDDTLLLNESTVDQYYSSVSASSLLIMLEDDSLKEYFVESVEALVQVLKYPRMHMLVYFDAFCARLLQIMNDENDDYTLLKYIKMYTKLVETSTHNTSPFLVSTLELIKNRFNETLSDGFLDLIFAFLNSIRDGYAPYATDTICLLINCLDDSKTVKPDTAIRVLKIFSILGIYANDIIYLIVPTVTDTIFCEQTHECVRVASFECLMNLSKATDIFITMGPVIRALELGISSQHTPTKNASIQLLYTLLRAYGKQFLTNASPVFDYIKRNKLETLELRRIVAAVNKDQFADSFRPIEETKEVENIEPHTSEPIFNDEVIISKIAAPNLGTPQHLERWLRSVILSLISSSPSPPIRACTAIANSYFPFAKCLFKPAFFSCWQKLKKRGQIQITNSFRELLVANENYDTVVREIIDLLVFMDKIEHPLNIPTCDIVSACLRYGREPFALRLQQQIFENETNEKSILNLIDIFVQMNEWSNASGVWQKSVKQNSTLNRTDVMTRLRMWDQVEPLYREKFEKYNDLDAFMGLTESLAAMAMWPQLMSYIQTFHTLKRQQKREVAPYFAEAAMHLGKWDVLDDVIQYAPDYNSRVNILSAINALYKDDMEKVNSWVIKGFSLLASRPITFWAENQQIHTQTMLTAQELVEIEEMKEWKLGNNREKIENVWNQRMKTAPRDFELWFHILANRTLLTDIRDDILIQFFELKSQTLGTKIHSNAFDILFPNFDPNSSPDLHKICYVVANYNVGNKEKAIEDMARLTEIVHGPLQTKCHYYYASWLMEADESYEALTKAYDHLKPIIVINQEPCSRRKHRSYSNSSDGSRSSSGMFRTSSNADKGVLRLPSQILEGLTIDITNILSLRKWADVNTALAAIDKESAPTYVTNAIDALTSCAQQSPLFPDVVQLLNIFFEHADQPEVFNSTAHACIEKLPAKLLIQASPQLLIQLSHPTAEVSAFVHDVLFQLLCEHYHSIIFSVIVMKFSKNVPRARAADRLLREFHHIKPQEYEEVNLIRKALLRAAVTWSEKVVQRITDAFDHYSRHNIDRMLASLTSIITLVRKPKCENQEQFHRQYDQQLNQLESLLKHFTEKNMGQISSWCQKMQDDIGEELKRIHMIQLSSISPELGQKTHFKLAVPGTYKPNQPPILIKYFVGQFKVYMSKQQPKDVVVMGEDGNFYQYLLKGHEDLRLDERIMQFFRLINSFLKKETILQSNLIETMCVIPLSISHGLVQWVSGTDTLRSVIEQYRKLHNREPLEEYGLLEQVSTTGFDIMMPVQKQQVIQKIFDMVPDTDIANFFWLKAPSAELWMKQIQTFAVSTAMTSIVGYVIGLGDRHPSNLLIDRYTGKVIHIDFGDCFERAAMRPFLPEVVPFRLTRMMVKAMGPTGVDGLFKSSFISMSNLLRDNKRVLVMVLAIFVHEPLIDPDQQEEDQAAVTGQAPAPKRRYLSKAATGSVIDKGRVFMADENDLQSSVEMRNRVRQKLSGLDFGDTPLSVEDQATILIENATNTYCLAKMYSGWCPFW